MDSKIIEILKEALRVILLAVVSFFLTEGVVGYLAEVWLGKSMTTESIVVVTGLILSVLRGVEKSLHKEGRMSLPF